VQHQEGKNKFRNGHEQVAANTQRSIDPDCVREALSPWFQTT